jgi:hypothetical protein
LTTYKPQDFYVGRHIQFVLCFFFRTTCGNTFYRTACGKVRRHYLSEMNKIKRIYHTVIDKLSFFVIHLFYIDSEVIKKNYVCNCARVKAELDVTILV